MAPRSLLLLLSIAVIAAAAAAIRPAEARQSNDSGFALYQRDCAVCHGVEGQGSYRGPDITRAGAGGVAFVLTSGRMPIDDPQDGLRRSEPSYDPEEIQAIVAYVDENFVDGPPVPEVDVTGADVAKGGELYRLNCGSCHQSAGQGGALAYGTTAPPLGPASPVEVVEAMRLGPGNMPVFEDDALDDGEAAAIAAYVEYLEDPQDPGGLALGHLGPVPEGLVAWLFGLGSLVLVTRWLGVRLPSDDQR